MRRKICVITGTRADYGILYSVLDGIRRSKDLRLQLVVTGMHLMREFGSTMREIRRDGFPIADRVDISYTRDTPAAMGRSVGQAVVKLTASFSRLRPDVVFVLGDRGEMLAAAIAANYLNIPVAHAHGGEVSGHVDGVLRHAITKLAHLHFAPTAASAERIRRLGEEPWRVRVSGAPALDRLRQERLPAPSALRRQFGLGPREPFAVLVQHPVAAEADHAAGQLAVTLSALEDAGLRTVVSYPNADAGGRKMIRVLERRARAPQFSVHRNLPHTTYLGLLRIAAVLIGNSSSGIIEAPSFRIPVINIGSRQEGRERSENILDVPHERSAIARALRVALHDGDFKRRAARCRNHYGDGRAGERIVRALRAAVLGPRLVLKRITY